MNTDQRAAMAAKLGDANPYTQGKGLQTVPVEAFFGKAAHTGRQNAGRAVGAASRAFRPWASTQALYMENTTGADEAAGDAPVRPVTAMVPCEFKSTKTVLTPYGYGADYGEVVESVDARILRGGARFPASARVSGPRVEVIAQPAHFTLQYPVFSNQ